MVKDHMELARTKPTLFPNCRFVKGRSIVLQSPRCVRWPAAAGSTLHGKTALVPTRLLWWGVLTIARRRAAFLPASRGERPQAEHCNPASFLAF